MKSRTTGVDRLLRQFRAAVRESGVKLTQQRLEIFREVATSVEHPDAEAVFQAVRPRMPTVSLDTVYRTLWLLNDLGLIKTLGPRRGSARFDGNTNHHHHYICVRCGLTRDFESAEFNALRIPGAVKKFGRVVATQVEVQGICESCTEKDTGESPAGSPGLPRAKKGKRNGR
jgi:Fur family peroxide stress response transcriptional regulator